MRINVIGNKKINSILDRDQILGNLENVKSELDTQELIETLCSTILKLENAVEVLLDFIEENCNQKINPAELSGNILRVIRPFIK